MRQSGPCALEIGWAAKYMDHSPAADGVNCQQTALTVITRLKPGQAAGLETLLDRIGGPNITNNSYIRFAAVSTLHFSCWVVFHPDPPLPPTLASESHHNRPV